MIVTEDKPLLSVELPIELTNGNDGRTKHFSQSAKFRRRVELILRGKGHVYTPLDFPIWYRVTRLMGPRQRLWDASSGFRGNWKECEDALVACGWFKDDSPEWVTDARFAQEKGHTQPGIRVEIFRSGK